MYVGDSPDPIRAERWLRQIIEYLSKGDPAVSLHTTYPPETTANGHGAGLAGAVARLPLYDPHGIRPEAENRETIMRELAVARDMESARLSLELVIDNLTALGRENPLAPEYATARGRVAGLVAQLHWTVAPVARNLDRAEEVEAKREARELELQRAEPNDDNCEAIG